jgi:hypothetical protein
MADLEAIKRDDRASYFSAIATKPQRRVTVSAMPDQTVKVSVTMGPDDSVHPGLHKILAERFGEAFALGIRFMYCPRIGIPRPRILDASRFVAEADDSARRARLDRFFEAGQAIYDRGVGHAVVETLGLSLGKIHGRPGTWLAGLGLARSDSELKLVADAVSEWADGDSVAAHVGYQNDFFCTRDRGVGAGNSVFNRTNRAWIADAYGVVFVTPAELGARLS